MKKRILILFGILFIVSVNLSVASEGDACTNNDDCEYGYFCELVNNCKGGGVCKGMMGSGCWTTDFIIESICGCDAKNYFSDCSRINVGVSIKHQGMCADVNKDNKVDALDTQLAINQALGLMPYSIEADMNNDKGVDIFDVQRIINIALGLEKTKIKTIRDYSKLSKPVKKNKNPKIKFYRR